MDADGKAQIDRVSGFDSERTKISGFLYRGDCCYVVFGYVLQQLNFSGRLALSQK